MSAARPPAQCAVCGADLPRSAHACPECGADERTGWREQSLYDGLDLPDEAFDDGESQAAGKRSPTRGKGRFWWVVALIMLAVVVVLVGLNRFWIAP